MSRDLTEKQLALKTDAIELCSDQWDVDGGKVFNTLSSVGILDILDESYDVLHMVGNIYLVNWIEEALENRGVNIDELKK
jgi:hypothetical protein